MKKRILSLALVLLMTLALAAPACAADDGWQKFVLEDVDGYLTVTLSAAKVEEKTVTLEESLYSDLPRHEEKAKIFTLQRGSTVSVVVNEKVVDNLDDWYLDDHMEEAGVTDPKDLIGKDSFIHYGAYYKKVAEDHYICVDLYPIYGGTVGDDWDESMTYIPGFSDGESLCLLQVETKSADGKWDRVEITNGELTVTFSQARLEEIPFTEIPYAEGDIAVRTKDVIFVSMDCHINIFLNQDITQVSESEEAYYLQEFSVSSLKELVGRNCYYHIAAAKLYEGDYDPIAVGICEVGYRNIGSGTVDEIMLPHDYIAVVFNYYVVPENYDFQAPKSFVDVPADAYYAEPVAWAAEYDITNGTDDTHFSPEELCTRAQIVTFLFRDLA